MSRRIIPDQELNSNQNVQVANEQSRNQLITIPENNLVLTGSRMASDGKTDIRLDVLKEDNYITWKWHMTIVLDTKGLMQYVTNEDMKNDERAKLAASLISSALSDDNRQRVINCSTAYDIWKALEANYENKSSSERAMLLEKFHSFKIRSTLDIGKALGEIKALVAKLKQLGANIEDEQVSSVILRALPDSLNDWKRTWKMVNSGEIDLNKLTTSIMAEVTDLEKVDNNAFFVKNKEPWSKVVGRGNRMKGPPVRPNPKPQNNFQQKQPSKGNGNNNNRRNDQCNYCKAKGHWARDCNKLKAKNASQGQQSRRPNAQSRRPNRSVSFMAADSDIVRSDTESWIADSGCTTHMTPNRDWITDYKEFSTAKFVTLGDNHKIVAKGYGNIETNVGIMKKVYYVPELTANLFSISAAAKNGIEITCKALGMDFKFEGEKVITAKMIHGIYLLYLKVEKPSDRALAASSIDEWHERFAHVSKDRIKLMAKTNAVKDLRIDSTPEKEGPCLDCAVGKCHKTSHRQATTPKTKIAGACLHMDTVGPMQETSIGGSKYMVLCKDEATSYRRVKFVSTKAEIPSYVKMMIKSTTIDTANEVATLRTDNGTEFKNTVLKEYLLKKGIEHKFSVEYTPQQNGFIERDIRTVVEAARGMLHRANLPESLWPEAVNTAIYVLNRCINNSNQRETPFELYYGHKPSVKNLHTFGQPAIVLYRNQRNSKFSEKGIRQIFVGYTERFNTFRFFDAETNHVYTSCDAVFLKENGRPVTVVSRSIPESITTTIEDQDYSRSESPATEVSFRTAETQSQPERKDSPETNQDSTRERSASEEKISTPPTQGMVRSSSLEHTCTPALKKKFCDVHPMHIVQQRLRPRRELNFANLTTIEAEEDPKTYKEAMKRNDRDKWLIAMQEEIDSLKKNQVWELVDRPRQNVVTNKWVLKIKRKPDGTVDRYKARLVARGFSQVYGIDYMETYAPVVNMASIRMLFAYAAENSLYMSQFDVKTAFLYGDLDETVYMEQPEGFKEDNQKVCKLKRSLYGLKQSPRQWNLKFSTFLTDMDLQVSENDWCIFYRNDGKLIVAIYVDDGLILASNEEDIIRVMTALKERFEVHSVKATTFLGFQIERPRPDEITLHQGSYIRTILKRFNMSEAKPVDAPITMSKLEVDETLAEVPYREAIGSLMYAAVTTRIDIAYAVNKASRAVENPTRSDWAAVKRIFRYLKDKEDYGITYKRGNSKLVAYCDSDFAGDDKTGRSTTGLVVNYAGGPIQWKSQRQKLVTLSSTEAEFVSICTTVKEVTWLRKLAMELGMINEEPTKLYCDNQSAIRIASNEKCVHRTRHMKVQASYPREQMERGEVDIQHVRTDNQLADMLTKPTSIQKFRTNSLRLMSTHAMICAMVCLIMCSPTLGFIFDRVSPIVIEDTDYKVDSGTNQYEVDFIYVNPCESIRNLSSKHTLPILKQMDGWVYDQLREDCQKAYEEQWLKPLADLLNTKTQVTVAEPHHLRKRAVVPVIIGAGLAFYAITNLVMSLFGIKYIAAESERQVQIEANQLRKFETTLLATKHIQEGIINTTEALAAKLDNQEKALERLTVLLPSIAWKSTHLYTAIGRGGSNLKKIREQYKLNRLHIQAVADLWNTTDFDGLKPEDTLLESIILTRNKTVNFKFLAKRAANEMKVFKIVPFDKWENLTDPTPTLLKYDGPRFAIHNSTNHCTKAIESPDPKGNWILEECLESNYTDPRLEQWQARPNYGEKATLPKVVKSLMHNYISCFHHTITVPDGTFECPPYPFRLPHDVAFSTTGHTYTPRYIKKEYREGQTHLQDSSRLFKTRGAMESDEVSMLKTIKELKMVNRATETELKTSVVIARYGLIWWIGFALSTFTTLVTILHLYTWVQSHIVKIGRKPKSPTELDSESHMVTYHSNTHTMDSAYPHLQEHAGACKACLIANECALHGSPADTARERLV